MEAYIKNDKLNEKRKTQKGLSLPRDALRGEKSNESIEVEVNNYLYLFFCFVAILLK